MFNKLFEAQTKTPLPQGRIVIKDASCIIDLHKVNLVEAALGLPYLFQIAYPVRFDELESIPPTQWDYWDKLGLQTIDLPGELVTQAQQMQAKHPKLSFYDAVSLVLTQHTPDGILLTGDKNLRVISSTEYQIDVHGILWITDQLHQHKICAPKHLLSCLTQWDGDEDVRLPKPALKERIERMAALC